MFAQSVSSFHSPLCWSFQRRLVATENLVTATPAGVNLVSASRPRCPTRITLLTLRDAIIHALYHTNSCLSRRPNSVSRFSLGYRPSGSPENYDGARLLLSDRRRS